MRADRQEGNRAFGLLWFLANTFGWGLYLVVLVAASWVLGEFWRAGFRLLANVETGTFLMFAIGGFCWGAIVGGLQQFVLTRRFELAGSKWAWATIVGLALYAILEGMASLFFIYPAPNMRSFNIVNSIGACVPPLALGIAQWCVLRRYFARSGWWIAATALALWVPSVALPILTPAGNAGIPFVIASYPVKGFIYGAGTLLALAVISRQSIAAVESD